MKFPLAPSILLLVLALSACGGSPPAPDWKKDSISLINKYSKAELKGENKLAERYFEQALDAAGSAGKLEETARLHLIRCATRQASLSFEQCSGYLEFAKFDTSAGDATYYRFISGQWENLDGSKLPALYRDFFSSQDAAKRQTAIEKISDPLSRLIAVSVAVQRKQADDTMLNLAVETASEQGWRRPLLVYLKLLENHANLRGDSARQDALRARIKLVESSMQ